jgi:hypothetical protein
VTNLFHLCQVTALPQIQVTSNRTSQAYSAVKSATADSLIILAEIAFFLYE